MSDEKVHSLTLVATLIWLLIVLLPTVPILAVDRSRLIVIPARLAELCTTWRVMVCGWTLDPATPLLRLEL